MEKTKNKTASVLYKISIGAITTYILPIFIAACFFIITGCSGSEAMPIIIGIITAVFFAIFLSIFILKMIEISTKDENLKTLLFKINKWISFGTAIISLASIFGLIIFTAIESNPARPHPIGYLESITLIGISGSMLLSTFTAALTTLFVCSVILEKEKQIEESKLPNGATKNKVKMKKKNIVFASLTAVFALMLIVSSVLFPIYILEPSNRYSQPVVNSTGYPYYSSPYSYRNGYTTLRISNLTEETAEIEVRITILATPTWIGEPFDVVLTKTDNVENGNFKYYDFSWTVPEYSLFSLTSLEYSINGSDFKPLQEFNGDMILWSYATITAFSIMMTSVALLGGTITIWAVGSAQEKKKLKASK